MNRIIKLILPIAVLILAGCASVPKDAGFNDVQKNVAGRLDQPVEWRRGGAEDAEADARVQQLLAQPLTADAAVQVALLNSRALQAEYEELGVAQADVVQAGLLRNPTFGWSHLTGGGPDKTTMGVELDFLGLLLAAPRKRIENVRFEHTRLRVTQAVLRHAAETRKAWAEALAAEQAAGLLAQVNELAQVEADLAARQRKAGNTSERELLLRQAFAAETRTAQFRAAETANAARERLNRLMGLGDQHAAWSLPPRLPELPAASPVFADLEGYGLRQRLDLQMAQKEAEAFSTALGLTRSTRFINVLDLGVETEKDTGDKRITGPTLRIELPIFDQGQARISKQEAQYRQSEMRLYDSVVVARSEIREAQQRLATAWQTATEARDVLSPLRRRIVEQSALQYNGMLIGPYELLAAAREQVNAAQIRIAAVRDYWTALADLQMAVGGKLPPEAGAMGGQEGDKK